MVHFTVQHILIMRLVTQFNFPSFKSIHTLLYLASANNLEKHDIGFYDFIRTTSGVYSFSLQSIIEELIQGELMDRKTIKLTEKGHHAYYALARALTPFEDYWARCVSQINLNPDFDQLQKSLKRHVLYRKAKINGKLFPVD
ncbi:hypothetical protein [Thermincola potens]|uniref:Uncharacterized protein n=1 Tax=Thermincola potens (strain JR) TaxID=635013 RepID=D5XEG5_THEPJ|nr:hypothetical protein [Thermincola potens]ADG82036.1 hypothetical protein TherJR_1172 [Thermincola potens JR]